jgi:hypothetical protein
LQRLRFGSAAAFLLLPAFFFRHQQPLSLTGLLTSKLYLHRHKGLVLNFRDFFDLGNPSSSAPNPKPPGVAIAVLAA